MKMKSIEEVVYSKMCGSCPKSKYCHEECITCEEFDNELKKAKHRKCKRFKQLTHIEKCEIYNAYQSGHYYLLEIERKYNITDYTIRKVVGAFESFLRTGTPKDL